MPRRPRYVDIGATSKALTIAQVVRDALEKELGPAQSRPLAAMDRSDRDHVACAQLLEATEEELVIPAPILPELDY